MKRKSTLTNKNNKKIKITKNLENQEKSVSEDNTMINIMNSLQKCLYKCNECNMVCFNKMSHLMEKHFDELINCPHCSQSISVKDFENHFQICQPLLFECAFCDQTFPTKKICVSHSDNCPNREKFGISCENVSENNEKTVKNIENIEDVNVVNNAVVNDNCSRSTDFIERCEMSPSVTTKIDEEQIKTYNDVRKIMKNTINSELNEKSTKILYSTQNDESIDSNSCDMLIEQFLDVSNNEFDSVFQDSGLISKVVEKLELRKLLNNNNEELLRNIFPNEINSNSDNHKTEKEIEPGVRILDMMQSLINPPKPRVINHGQELIPLARKKRLFIEKEKKNLEKQELEKERKAKEITFTKLIAMDERNDLAIEAEIDKVMNNIDIETIIDATSTFHEEELLFDEDIYLPDEEIDEIMKICEKRNNKQITSFYENIKTTEYIDPKNLTNCSIAAQYDCHICGSFSTDQFSEFYTHLSIHNNEIFRKV